MRVLVACEESQEVCKAFRANGHEAYSCDIQEESGGHPEWHIQGDCLPLLNGNCTFTTRGGQTVTIEGKWDLIIAHPPCTDLAVSGARWFPEKQKDFRQQKACVFFMQIILSDCERIAVENPVGIMSSVYKKPTQIIHPWMFGDPVSKATCLWERGLPKLVPTKIVDPKWIKDNSGKRYSGAAFYATDDVGKAIPWNDPRTKAIRSKTFPGIAKAMANQWGGKV